MVTTLIRFLVPGTSNRFRCGGLSVELQTARLVAGLCATEVVTYRQRQLDSPFLDDCLKAEKPEPSVLWIVSWGFDVPGLIRRLRGHRVAYHAHSSGYGFDLLLVFRCLPSAETRWGIGEHGLRGILFVWYQMPLRIPGSRGVRVGETDCARLMFWSKPEKAAPMC